jgi:ferredoxin-NADP reductase
MISYEPEKPRLSLLIRRSHGGVLTSQIFKGECDEDVEVFGPLGHAIFTTAAQRPFIAVAGGSGIARMMAIEAGFQLFRINPSTPIASSVLTAHPADNSRGKDRWLRQRP